MQGLGFRVWGSGTHHILRPVFGRSFADVGYDHAAPDDNRLEGDDVADARSRSSASWREAI